MEPSIDESREPLHIGPYETAYLNEAATWAKFLAVVGFVLCGLVVIMSFFAGSIIAALGTMEETPLPPGMGAVLTVVYLLGALLYFFPCLYLFNFATKAKHALSLNDQMSMMDSFRNLKSCFRFLGILTIIVLCLYGLALIAITMGALAFKM